MKVGPFVLEISRGRDAGRKAVVRRGQVIRFGRTERADLFVARDAQLSGLHFAVDWTGPRPLLRDLGSIGGTELNGQPVTEAQLAHGDWIHAGSTDLAIHDAALAARGGEGMMVPIRAAALERLDDELDPLFGVVDASRGDRVRELLRAAEERYQSLYDGPKADALADVAPYLVALPRVSPLLELLVREGWTERWGVYFTCPLRFDDVRRHLRRFLMVQDEESGERSYFRFYDPATLRVFLPTCSPRQAATFYGQIGRFYAEGEKGEVLVFERPSPSIEPGEV